MLHLPCPPFNQASAASFLMAMAARYLILEKGKQAGLAGALKRGRGHFLHGETLGLNPGIVEAGKVVHWHCRYGQIGWQISANIVICWVFSAAVFFFCCWIWWDLWPKLWPVWQWVYRQNSSVNRENCEYPMGFNYISLCIYIYPKREWKAV